jgi:hypothetical protein
MSNKFKWSYKSKFALVLVLFELEVGLDRADSHADSLAGSHADSRTDSRADARADSRAIVDINPARHLLDQMLVGGGAICWVKY